MATRLRALWRKLDLGMIDAGTAMVFAGAWITFGLGVAITICGILIVVLQVLKFLVLMRGK